MKKKYTINMALLLNWIIFFPMILFIAIITGAIQGVNKVLKQAEVDILDFSTNGNTF